LEISASLVRYYLDPLCPYRYNWCPPWRRDRVKASKWNQQGRWKNQERTVILEEEPKGHSFTNQIMEAQLPPNWKDLNVDRYDLNQI